MYKFVMRERMYAMYVCAHAVRHRGVGVCVCVRVSLQLANVYIHRRRWNMHSAVKWLKAVRVGDGSSDRQPHSSPCRTLCMCTTARCTRLVLAKCSRAARRHFALRWILYKARRARARELSRPRPKNRNTAANIHDAKAFQIMHSVEPPPHHTTSSMFHDAYIHTTLLVLRVHLSDWL